MPPPHPPVSQDLQVDKHYCSQLLENSNNGRINERIQVSSFRTFDQFATERYSSLIYCLQGPGVGIAFPSYSSSFLPVSSACSPPPPTENPQQPAENTKDLRRCRDRLGSFCVS